MLALALLLAGCLGGEGAEEPTPTPSGAAAPTAHRTVPPGFIECEGRPPKDGELVADVDLTTLSAPVPPGFRAASGYEEDHPVEGAWEATYWVPLDQQDLLDVVNLVIYPQMELGPLTVTCDMISWADITARIAQYHEINGAEVIEETSRTSVAGLPAVREVVALPGSGYSYVGYWIFGRGQVAHLYCQWVQDEARIVAGCEDYIASVTVS